MTPPKSLGRLSDARLWRHSRNVDAPEDDAARFLDLAGYADGLLDPDEHERVAEWLVRDSAGRADIAVARALAGTEKPGEPVSEAIVARAVAVAVATEPMADREAGKVIPFSPGRSRSAGLQEMARWGSLAAAVVFASWLGFTLGMALSFGRTGDDGALNEFFDPSTSLIRDLTEGSQT
jgi:anti-sigma factor RsiW